MAHIYRVTFSADASSCTFLPTLSVLAEGQAHESIQSRKYTVRAGGIEEG